MGLTPLEEARSYVLERCGRLEATSVVLRDALGLVAAAPVVSGEQVPPFDNTAMDGFAVRAADTLGASKRLRVVATLAAGDAASREVGPGEAIRIMTGAPVPPGADAIVMVERTELSSDGSEVEVAEPAKAGRHIRRAGEDIEVGDQVVAEGAVLTPGHLGLLASIGCEKVDVVRRARVGVLSTGDELVEGSGPLRPGQIRDSNRLTLVALVEQMGAEPVDLGRIPDDEAAIEAAVRRGLDSCDALLSSGGVSMGDFDYVKVVLDRLGEMRWMQVAIKPAKPLAFGMLSGKPVFGLPGNPVSAMVSFELFARPGAAEDDGPHRHRPALPAGPGRRGSPEAAGRQGSLRPGARPVGRGRSASGAVVRRPGIAPALGDGEGGGAGGAGRRGRRGGGRTGRGPAARGASLRVPPVTSQA